MGVEGAEPLPVWLPTPHNENSLYLGSERLVMAMAVDLTNMRGRIGMGGAMSTSTRGLFVGNILLINHIFFYLYGHPM